MQETAATAPVPGFDDREPVTTQARPHTIVLQPGNQVGDVESLEFRESLSLALNHAIDAVIVDLLWANSLSASAIATLAAGIRQATVLGKALTFQSVDRSTRQFLEAEWHRQRALVLGPWNTSFAQDLENFLDHHIQKPEAVTKKPPSSEGEHTALQRTKVNLVKSLRRH